MRERGPADLAPPVRRLRPLSPRGLADQAAEAIRALIDSGELQGGQRLVEAQVADQLAVSRGTIRDAFRRLVEEGLLRDVPRRGTYVVALGADDVRDLLDLRAGLETRAARLVIEADRPELLRPLEEALDRLAAAGRSGDAAVVGAADFAFHEALCRASGSSRLLSVFVRYEAELRTLLRSDQESLYRAGVDVADDHRRLLAALRTGDPALAESAVREHVEETRDRLVRDLADRGAEGAG